MARWAIGDLQGCFHTFKDLLDRLSYRHERDELWIAGDLVNRGAGSAACLDWLTRNNVKVVLGNHDLHCLAFMLGLAKSKPSDTLDAIQIHPRKHAMFEWLLSRPLVVRADHWMSHAGLYPQWTQAQAEQLAMEAERAWNANPEAFFSQMYGNQPDRWDESLEGIQRHRFVVNALTRMRMIGTEGALNMSYKGSVSNAPDDLTPWYQGLEPVQPILFGHWAALNEREPERNIFALDSGCVWGQSLSALNLDTHQWVQQPTNPRDMVNV